ncbi:L-ascorbate metabolism protein UlaG (beta-lactamase superfamily) [Chitinophaga polysaccharea]|uniref:L-ascorbate metabolism protein UlaG (Beta-lactamase superfamily) n=1 Tax=Chitinophaga polysaccharea TaxID=1293035 RepID=A0A561PWS8_9BACT|nr:MBL fold metallo-hydrolase [Chitinophaga polysaccharea]TWF42528.1 L-ascorbate metabolism protein UlaG (beta-lactamase superfamily) [Chitinophaga polysaccharea]
MTGKKLYLKPNVVIEPLVDRWYAWSHLLSPATAAMNIAGRHLTIMESYLKAPAIHAEAVRNPKMKGGPFMDVAVDRLEEVRRLYEHTCTEQDHMIRFATAVKELDTLLATTAIGAGLEPLYQQVPDLLKGYVELFYDRNNNADFRFFESLLYNSEYYNRKGQSIALWITDNDHRPFCLSTPRLEEDHVLQLPLSFDHPGIDALSRMKREPRDPAEIKALLGITEQQEGLFNTFFTTEAPPPYQRYIGDKIRMRYFGHACILVETKDVSILVDPLISYYGYHSDVEHFSDVDLPDVIDYVLITHNHQDHILFETLLPLRHKIKHLIVPRTNSGSLEDPDLRLMFQYAGFRQVVAIDEMETIPFADATITGLPFTGEHSDLNILTKSCYLVKIGAFKLLFLADSRIIESALYQHIQRAIGDVDVMFLGMECDGAPLTWLYGPLMTKKISREFDHSRRLAGSDCEKGMALVDIFHPREVYIYAMGMEPWLEFISSIKYTAASNPIIQSDQLIALSREKGIIAERLYGEKEMLYQRKEACATVA